MSFVREDDPPAVVCAMVILGLCAAAALFLW